MAIGLSYPLMERDSSLNPLKSIRVGDVMPKLCASILYAGMLIISSAAATESIAACTVPNQLTNDSVTDATKVMGNFAAIAGCMDSVAPGGSANAIQYNAGGNSFGGAAALADGQLLIGSTGNPPQAGQIAAGAGMSATKGPGTIILSTTGSGTGATVDWLNRAAIVRPVAANFTLRTSTVSPTGAKLSATSRGMLLSTTATIGGRALMADMSVSSGHWQATMLSIYTGPLSVWTGVAIGVRDTVNNKAITFGMSANNSTSVRFDYVKLKGGNGLDTYDSDTAVQDIGLPYPTEPIWSRLTYDGTNLIWSFSQDGEHFTSAFSVSATNYLTNLNTIGPVVTTGSPATNPTWSSGLHIFSWQLVSI